MKEYCDECGNRFDYCTCIKCSLCRKYYGLHHLYDRDIGPVCISCLNFIERDQTNDAR